jgi:hypothetical protein
MTLLALARPPVSTDPFGQLSASIDAAGADELAALRAQTETMMARISQRMASGGSSKEGEASSKKGDAMDAEMTGAAVKDKDDVDMLSSEKVNA